jgi:putative hydrolase of the HAD superfamily
MWSSIIGSGFGGGQIRQSCYRFGPVLANISPAIPFTALKAVAFDLDDTLFDRRPALELWLDRWLGPAAAAAALAEVLARDGGGQAPRREFHAWLDRRFPALAPSGRRFRRDFPGCIVPDPALPALLSRLRAAGIRLAVLSDGSPAMQAAKLRACGAAPFFVRHEVLVSGALGFAKPDPRAFAALLETLGLPAAEVLFVGDDPRRDIAGARAAGLWTCRLRRPGRVAGGDEADLVLDSLADFPKLPGGAA